MSKHFQRSKIYVYLNEVVAFGKPESYRVFAARLAAAFSANQETTPILVFGSLLRLSFLKNQLISSKFALHENDRVAGLIDLASPTIDLKSLEGAFKDKASLEQGKTISLRARDDGTRSVRTTHTFSFHQLRFA